MVGWVGGGLFDYSVSPGPFFREFDTKSVNMKVRKVCWWGGGLFDYSVTLGPSKFRPGPGPWTGSNLDTGLDLVLDNIMDRICIRT